MDKAGIYRFVLHFYDDYADSYKNHQVKTTPEVNQEIPIKGYLLIAREHPLVGQSEIVDSLISYAQKSSFVTDTVAKRFGRKLIFYQETWLKELEGWPRPGKSATKPDKVVICITVTHADIGSASDGSDITGLRFEDDPGDGYFEDRIFTRKDVRIRRKKERKLFFAVGCVTARISDLADELRSRMDFPCYGGFTAYVIQRDAAKWTEIFFKKATLGRNPTNGRPYTIKEAAEAASIEYDEVWKDKFEDPLTNDRNRPSSHYKFYGDTNIRLVK